MPAILDLSWEVRARLKIGVVPGEDMTSEAALAKLAYVLSDPSLTTYDMRKKVSRCGKKISLSVPARVYSYS